jgi:hypothetical protein
MFWLPVLQQAGSNSPELGFGFLVERRWMQGIRISEHVLVLWSTW